ncbi:16S rRNA (cytosine(967)-C(5))-methyltransferase RsmB [Candidatus Methylopumilus universalis]|uniref:16S rRNA (cytosine(967)-C(5))-methyltransferase RsmB n=1 Tax=Candidatus Methylopumilus universalis TaxID=2588536 RepID=UPI00111DDE3F|nr:16S rRNA (cytosine(967)-C(5))-methyltransferase RsmB [Candidatus Methylopumilus universalis]QDC79719.1 16S rRNA (cytosine(967)-C(5))-methyltransferase RsmB [Candidatus Methylopumilus universalis]QDC81008.1 16S rRNA (cytosine(967)-C(5))-methyltransferase RsmB [Candidatus Methylopumilus universalis]QDC87445.1 16S rRNA (cytosine(967)-C(5))-methyltransferase RsmB [Candidatus Methylopumilus universalis]
MHQSQLIAADCVSEVIKGHNLNQVFERRFEHHQNITPQQKSVAIFLAYGAIRYLGENQFFIQQLIDKKITNKKIEALLCVALFQLNHDQSTDFTVVNEAVEAAKLINKSWAGSFVNGVLRNFIRQKEKLQTELKNDEEAFYSYPLWWINLIKQNYPKDWESILLNGNKHPPLTLRINERQTNLKQYEEKLKSEAISYRVLGNIALELTQPTPVEKIPGFMDGEVSIQDFGAQLAAKLLDLQDGQFCLDACSAPGGKTGHMLEIADIELVSIDQQKDRLYKVKENLERLHLHAYLKCADLAAVNTWWNEKLFDRILLDAPCSASGVVRRHVDIKWLRRPRDIEMFAKQQEAMLEAMWQLLKKGGKLLYATCSIFYDENQKVINHFIKEHTDAKEVEWSVDSEYSKYENQLIPSENHDGFFYALLEKK